MEREREREGERERARYPCMKYVEAKIAISTPKMGFEFTDLKQGLGVAD